METDTYKTIAAPSEGLYKEKGSRFIAFAFPVTDEEEIRAILARLKEKYYDAEPSSTAGKPIHGQILSNGLTDILIVVIRYFGGIKLGVPGLINAYREAAADALRHADIIEKTVDLRIHIHFSYFAMNDVMRIIKEENPDILSRRFEMECDMLLSIRKKDYPSLLARLEQVESLTFPDTSPNEKDF